MNWEGVRKGGGLIAFIVFAVQLQAQFVLVPDTNMRRALVSLGYGGCFDSSQTKIDTTCSAILNTDSLFIDQRDISDLTGIGYFKNLRFLNCYRNPFTVLPALPDSLTTLVSYDGLLDSLPASLPVCLRYLNIGDNFVSNLPPLPDSLRYFSCETNQLSNLPVLPPYLQYFTCNTNTIASMPALPASLWYLDCNTNALDSLPALPAGLTELICGFNHLSALPPLPSVMVKLYCNNNRLSQVPALPDSLSRFYCQSNNLSALPGLPAALTWLDCSYNLLSALPSLPDSLHYFDCSNNMQLYCLPQLKKIVTFFYDSTGMQCLPDYPQQNISSIPALSTYSLCGPVNPHGCQSYAGIKMAGVNDCTIGPNPFSNTLVIKSPTDEDYNYSISDIQGRILINGALQQGQANVNTAILGPGFYFLQLRGDLQVCFRLVKE